MSKSKKLELSVRMNSLCIRQLALARSFRSEKRQEVAGISLELFVDAFEKDKMTLRVPTQKRLKSRYCAPLASPM